MRKQTRHWQISRLRGARDTLKSATSIDRAWILWISRNSTCRYKTVQLRGKAQQPFHEKQRSYLTTQLLTFENPVNHHISLLRSLESSSIRKILKPKFRLLLEAQRAMQGRISTMMKGPGCFWSSAPFQPLVCSG